MNRSRLIRRIGKYLGKHLRHDPDQTGLEHAPGGWARVDGLIDACAKDLCR